MFANSLCNFGEGSTVRILHASSEVRVLSKMHVESALAPPDPRKKYKYIGGGFGDASLNV